MIRGGGRGGGRSQKRGRVAGSGGVAWVLQAPAMTAPIIGATKAEQLKELVAGVDLKLTAEEVGEMEKPYKPHRILGHAQPTPQSVAAASRVP